jgi:hypothetical protein
VAHIPGRRLEKPGFRPGLEGRHPLAVEIGDARRIGIARPHHVSEGRSRPDTRKVRLSVGQAGDLVRRNRA